MDFPDQLSPDDMRISSDTEFARQVSAKIAQRRVEAAIEMNAFLGDDWYVDKGPLSKGEPIECFCSHCDAPYYNKVTLTKAKRALAIGVPLRKCRCRRAAETANLIDKTLSEEWTVVNHGVRKSQKVEIVCSGGHTRNASLSEYIRIGKGSDDGRLWCVKCANKDAGATPPPSNDNPFLYPQEYSQ